MAFKRATSQPTADPHGDQPVREAGASLDEAHVGVVLLHGRGATAESILTLAGELGLDGVAYRAPQAVSRTWYPHSFLAPLDANEPYLTSALHTVRNVLQQMQDGGLPPERIVLLGFSQGACLASEVAARFPQRYGGVIAFSGGLIGSGQQDGEPPNDKTFDYEGSLQGTPAFFGCSDYDPHIPEERINQSVAAFRQLGAEVTKRIYPGMGHTVNQDELTFARDLLSHLRAS